MQPEYFDIHSHLNFKDYDADRDQVIQALKDNNIFTTTVGVDLESSKEGIALAEKHENLFATIGLHPADDPAHTFNETEFEKLVSHKKVVAIGECGLDYARLPTDTESEKKRQRNDFEKQIEFAVKHDKPLMIHCRDAYLDALTILKSKQQEFGEKVRGNFHFFTSPVEIAKHCLEIGFTVSFTGPITYTDQYNEVVSYVPIDRMMAETDAPFAAPVPFRGKRNNPLYVQEVVKKIAQIKGKSLDEVKKQLVATSFQLFLKNPLSKAV
jgi:TatD DNase family protein